MSTLSSLEFRFWKYTEKSSEENCWMYKGTTYNSYGVLTHKGKRVYVHRVSYEFHKGTIKEGLSVLHKCNNKLCVNPKHLYEGTHKDNARDRELTENHSRGAKNSNSTLTEEEVTEIKKLVQVEFWRTRKDIGEQFGVSHATISRIATGKTWKHNLCASQ